MPLLQRCKKCRLKKPCVKSYCRDCMPADVKQAIQDKKREKAKGYAKTTAANARANYKPTGEGELHVKLWLERPHICTGCDEKLYIIKPSAFSHTIRKAEDESLRLVEENFELECDTCHAIWDQGKWEDIVQQKNFKKRMEYIKLVRPDLYARKALKIFEHTGLNLNEL